MIYMYTNIHFVEHKIKRDTNIAQLEPISESWQLIKWNVIIVSTDHCMDVWR